MQAVESGNWAKWVGGPSMVIPLIVAVAFFMENLDATVISTSLPQMAVSFHVSVIRMSVGMTAYLMAAAVCITASGWLADRVGSRNLFCGAVGVFTAASMLCGAAPDFPVFIVGRVAQGCAAAMMSPVGRLVVLRTSQKSDLMRALSTLVWPGLVAPVLGPPLGGFITSIASWRWIFFVNLPVGLLGMGLIAAFVPNDRHDTAPFDTKGFLLTAVALSSLTYGLDVLGSHRGSGLGVGLALLGAAALVGSLATRHMSRSPRPLVRIDALRIRSFFVSSVTGGTICRAAISATPFLLPLMFQVAFGLSPVESGGLLLIYMAANLLMKLVTNRILRRFGIRAVLVATAGAAGVGIALCALIVPGASALLNGVVLAFAGASRSLQLTAITMANFADIAPAQRQPASVLSSLTQQVGMGAGVAIGALLLTASQVFRGSTVLGVVDFRVAFILAGALSTLAAVSFRTLAPDVGDEISGHRAT